MRKPVLKIRQRPVVRNVHEAGMLLSEGIGLARRLEDIQEAVGSGLYRLVPVEPVELVEMECRKALEAFNVD